MLARVLFIVIALTALIAAPLPAQSLADLARQEAERRQDVPENTRVITNKDLPGGGVGARAATPAKPAADTVPTKDPKSDATSPGASGTKGKDEDAVKDQKYWAGRQKDLKEQLARDQVYSEALQSRINALSTDVVNRDDPYQRAKLADDRIKAIGELQRVQTEIEHSKKEIVDIEEEARQAGCASASTRCRSSHPHRRGQRFASRDDPACAGSAGAFGDRSAGSAGGRSGAA